MLISIKTVSPIWTSIVVCLIVAFTVDTFENIRTRLAFLCSKLWRRQLIVFFTTPYLFPIVFGIMRFIALGTPGHVRSTTKGQITPFPIVSTLRNSWVHICSTDYSNNSSDIETSVDNQLSLCIILQIPDVNPNDSHIRFGRCFDYIRLGS